MEGPEYQQNNEYYQQLWKQRFHYTYFVSPVLSLSKNQSRWSFDLMYKFYP
jgi:hypothetical protein